MNDLTTVFVEITDKCNKRCRHCLNGLSNNKEKQEIDLLSFERLIWELKEFGVKQIKIVGGEPLTHTRFGELLSVLERAMMPFVIYTDHEGIAEYSEQLSKSKYIQNVRISIDGTQEIHDYIRMPGDFSKMCNTVALLQKSGVPTYMNFTINKINYKKLQSIWFSAKRLDVGIKFGMIKFCQNILSGNTLAFEPEEVQECLDEIEKFKTSIPDLYKAIWHGINDDQTFISAQKIEGNLHIGCYAGQQSCVIDSSGNIWPCGLLKGNKEFNYGNVFNGEFHRAWKKMNLEWSGLQKTYSCVGCEEAEFCTGGCRANAFYFSTQKTLTGRDPNCRFYNNSHGDIDMVKFVSKSVEA